MAVTQLKLVQDKPPVHNITTDPTRVVFERWVFMFGLQPNRTVLDPERRQVINAALALRGGNLQTILDAVDGWASAPLSDKPSSLRMAMRKLKYFLANSDRIEDCLELHDALQAAIERQQVAQAQPQQADSGRPEPSAEEVAAQREALRRLAARMAGREHG